VKGGERGYSIGPPRQIFKKIVNKNAIKVIKPKIGDLHPWQFCSKSLDSPLLDGFDKI
jgi:hypothetical protein